MDDVLRTAIEAALGARITRAAPVRGGDVAVAYGVELGDGRRVFAKTHPSAPAGFFTTEASGLAWLRAADAVAVPAVLAVSDDAPNHLVLEWIEHGRSHSSNERDFGVALARMHRAGAPSFGASRSAG